MFGLKKRIFNRTRIKLIKKTELGVISYWIYVNGQPESCFYKNEEERAEARYKALVENGGKPALIEVLKQTEI